MHSSHNLKVKAKSHHFIKKIECKYILHSDNYLSELSPIGLFLSNKELGAQDGPK